MYMFNIKRRYKLIVAPIQIKDVHSSVSYQWATNQKYTIGVVVDRLVAMGLYVTTIFIYILLGETSKFPLSNHKLFTKCYRTI